MTAISQREARRLKHQVAVLEEQLRIARSQLSPAFLYNRGFPALGEVLVPAWLGGRVEGARLAGSSSIARITGWDNGNAKLELMVLKQ